MTDKCGIRSAERGISDVQRIVWLTARHFNVSTAQINGPSRVEATAWARHVALGMCREFTSLTLAQIGKGFNRNFSTVRHCVHAMQNRCATNARAKAAVEELRGKIRAELQVTA